MSSAGRSRAMPKARAWPASTPSLAAIASDRAASEFGLHVVAPAIQDDAHNRTRFAMVTHPERHPHPSASGHDCTSLVVSVANRPGAVHDMLVPLKAHGVSMTRFESRPARSRPVGVLLLHRRAGPPRRAARGRGAQGTARGLRLLQGAGHLPDRRSLTEARHHVQATRPDRLRPDGRLVRARAQARRAGQAGGRLQQVALHHRDAPSSSA